MCVVFRDEIESQTPTVKQTWTRTRITCKSCLTTKLLLIPFVDNYATDLKFMQLLGNNTRHQHHYIFRIPVPRGRCVYRSMVTNSNWYRGELHNFLSLCIFLCLLSYHMLICSDIFNSFCYLRHSLVWFPVIICCCSDLVPPHWVI